MRLPALLLACLALAAPVAAAGAVDPSFVVRDAPACLGNTPYVHCSAHFSDAHGTVWGVDVALYGDIGVCTEVTCVRVGPSCVLAYVTVAGDHAAVLDPCRIPRRAPLAP